MNHDRDLKLLHFDEMSEQNRDEAVREDYKNLGKQLDLGRSEEEHSLEHNRDAQNLN
jgi:hypothetical protein